MPTKLRRMVVPASGPSRGFAVLQEAFSSAAAAACSHPWDHSCLWSWLVRSVASFRSVERAALTERCEQEDYHQTRMEMDCAARSVAEASVTWHGPTERQTVRGS